MKKICPCCNHSFECWNDNILECWCLEEHLSAEVRKYLSVNYQGCLCRPCIQAICDQFYQTHKLTPYEKV